MRKIFRFLIFFVFIYGCGIKGYPEQPLSYKPSPVKDLKAKQQGNIVVFYWKYDKTYEDGRKITEPFKFYAVSFNKKQKELKVKNYKDIFWFEEKIKQNKRTYCYRIFVKTKHKKSELSDLVCILVEGKYPSPLNLSLIPEEEGIRLNWNVKTDVNVYRGNSENVPPVLYQKVKKGKEFLDINVKFRKTFCYYITVPVNKYVEGIRSKTICINYTDTFPPEPPKDGFIQEENGYAYVFWDDSPSKDVKGYKIYKNGKLLIDMIVKTYYFKDKNYRKGDIYYITAVDNAGNESKPLIIR